jgi:hypothetical protein
MKFQVAAIRIHAVQKIFEMPKCLTAKDDDTSQGPQPAPSSTQTNEPLVSLTALDDDLGP